MLLFSSVKYICLVLLWWSKLKHVFKTLIGFTNTIKKERETLNNFNFSVKTLQAVKETG
jgi:hypothetical protein